MGTHEPATSPDHLSSIGSRHPDADHLRSEPYSFANPTQPPTVLGPITETASHSSGGVGGFPTPVSQYHLAGLDPSLLGSSQDESWDLGNPNTQIPAWFADDDFDLRALNSEILMSTANWLPCGDSDQHENGPVGDTAQILVDETAPSREELVRTHWYTFMSTPRTGRITPETSSEPTEVDEAYRDSLAVKLQPHIPFLPLPSTDFLVGLVSSY